MRGRPESQLSPYHVSRNALACMKCCCAHMRFFIGGVRIMGHPVCWTIYWESVFIMVVLKSWSFCLVSCKGVSFFRCRMVEVITELCPSCSSSTLSLLPVKQQNKGSRLYSCFHMSDLCPYFPYQNTLCPYSIYGHTNPYFFNILDDFLKISCYNLAGSLFNSSLSPPAPAPSHQSPCSGYFPRALLSLLTLFSLLCLLLSLHTLFYTHR